MAITSGITTVKFIHVPSNTTFNDSSYTNGAIYFIEKDQTIFLDGVYYGINDDHVIDVLDDMGITYNNGQLTINGDLVVEGSTITLDATNLLVDDNIIVLNSNLTTGTTVPKYTGIKALRGSGDPFAFVLSDEVNPTFRIGKLLSESVGPTSGGNNLQAVLTRDDTPASNGVFYWNNSAKKAVSLSPGSSGRSLVSKGTGSAPEFRFLVAGDITAGVFDAARIPTISGNKIIGGDPILGSVSASLINATLDESGEIPSPGRLVFSYLDSQLQPQTLVLTADSGGLLVGGSRVGTVTSIGLSLPNIFTVSNSPVTTSGSISATLASQSPYYVFAGPSSGSSNGTPSFRKLVSGDIPNLNASKITGGVLGVDRIPSLNASKITDGVFGVGRIPTLSAEKVVGGVLTVNKVIAPHLVVGIDTSSGNPVSGTLTFSSTDLISKDYLKADNGSLYFNNVKVATQDYVNSAALKWEVYE